MPLSKSFYRILVFLLICAFLSTSVYLPQARAGEIVLAVMPAPGTMVQLSPAFTPAHIQGITIHPDNALQFDFLIHKGDGHLTESQKKQEYTKLIKYFLASLTVPDKDQWVNLSPYEKGRIIDGNFGKTEMGRDLLEQDYLLKQITSSLMYPEKGLGKIFWDKVYARAWKEYHTTNVPVNTFNKVWIIPDEAVVYESGNTAYIIKSHLKVMLEEDYLSLTKHTPSVAHTVASQVIREVILPQIEREVNEGKNFSQLRQIVSGMILATWYKKALKESLLGKVYADQAKIQGINVIPSSSTVIYQRYLAAFKKGVYNYIKEDTDKYTQQTIPRKYFAGGFEHPIVTTINKAMLTPYLAKSAEQSWADAAMTTDMVMTNLQQPQTELSLPEAQALYRRSLESFIDFGKRFKSKKAILDESRQLSGQLRVACSALASAAVRSGMTSRVDLQKLFDNTSQGLEFPPLLQAMGDAMIKREINKVTPEPLDQGGMKIETVKAFRSALQDIAYMGKISSRLRI